MDRHAKGCTYWNDRSGPELCLCKGLGKFQEKAIEFVDKYPGWHTFNTTDGLTKHVIKRLENRGLVEINLFNQVRAISE